MPKEDSEISEAYSAINEVKLGPGNPETNQVKFRTARRRKPSRRNSRSKNNFDAGIDFDNFGEDFLDNMLGNQQRILSRMNSKKSKSFLSYSFLR